MTGWLWGLATILGPLLLLAVIVWVFLRNRKPPPSEIARADRGAKDLREQLEREDANDG